MARMARSQTNYRGATGGLAGVKTQSFAQEVPQIQSEGAGLDPFRGDLTNAFNQFFGSLGNTIATFQDAHFQNQKIEAEEYAVDMKKQATVSATDYYMENPKSRDVGAALSTTSPEQQGNKHFVDTFKSSLGANIGSRMYSDFALAQAQRAPSTFEANASQYWQDNYKEGTGDATVDMAMQTAWASNYETQRVTAAQETVRRQKAATDLEYRRSIYNKMAQPEITAATFNSILKGGTSRAGETTGQLQARNLGIMVNAAMTGRMSQNGIAKFIAHMNYQAQDPMDPSAPQMPSIAQKFPIMSAKAETSLMDAVQRNTTMAGQQAFSQMSSDFNTTLTNTQDEYAKLALIGNRGSAVVAKMQNTPGISMTQIAAFKKDLNTERSKLAEYHFNQVAMNSVANGLPPAPSYDPSENKSASLDWLNRNAPMGVDGASVKAGAFLKNHVQTFGAGNFPKNVQQKFASHLTSGDPAQQSYALEALMIADPTGASLASLLPKNDFAAKLGAEAAFIEMRNGASPQAAAAKTFNPGFIEAMQQLDGKGMGEILVPDAANEREREQTVTELFNEDAMGAMIQRQLLNEWRFTGLWSSISGIDIETQRKLRAAGKVYVAYQMSQDRDYSTEDVQQAAFNAVSNQMWVQNGIVKSGRQATNTAGGIVLGKEVLNTATGEVEDTVATLENDISNIENGAFSIFTEGTLTAKPIPRLGDNSQIVVNQNGMPVSLQVGQAIQVDSRYHPSGKERGFLSNSANWEYSQTFTGDLALDRAAAVAIFGPGIRLEPIYTGYGEDGAIGEYELIVMPRFVGTPKLTQADIERLALTPREYQPTRYGSGGPKPFYLVK